MLLSVLLQEFSSLVEVLAWIAGAGAVVLAGVVKARLLENWVYWHNLPVWVKKIVPVILAGVFGTLAEVLIVSDVTELVPQGVAVVLLSAINWLSSSMHHDSIKNSTFGESARLEAESLKG